MFGDKIDKMEDGKEKQLMKLIENNAKPFVRKVDGYAHKVDEDTEISYKDYNNQELTLKVPKGSYIVVGANDLCYPKIHTAEDFEGKNKFIDEKKEAPKKKDNGPKIGIALMGDEQMTESED